jgi:hypothetical protein
MEGSTVTKATSDGTRLNRLQMARALREGAGVEDERGAEQRMASVGRNSSVGRGLRRVGASVTLGVVLTSTLTASRITALRADFLQHAAAGGGRGGSIPGSPGPSVGSDGQDHSPIQDTNQEQQTKMFSKLTGVTAAIAVGASVTVAGAQNAAVQWKVSEGGNGHWYKLDSVLRTWDDARLTSISLGGHLATIQSAAENAEVTSLSTTPPPGIGRSCWLGGQQLSGSCEPGCGWMWITGEPFDFQYWAPGEPNNITGSEDYLHIWVTDQWNDTGAAQTAESVIEWDADCNNDGIVDYGQILSRQFDDLNGNNIPDCCEMGTPCVLPDACHVGETLLEDSFDAVELDPRLWRVVLPQECAMVTAGAGQVTCRGRGHLQTASEFPVAGTAIHVHSRFKFSDGLEIVAIQLLTDGAVTSGANYEACNNGLVVYFQPSAGDGVPIRIGGLGEISVGQPIARGVVQWQANEWFELDIHVDAHTIKVSMNKVSDPSVVAERLVSWSGTPRGFRVSLFDREFCGNGGVDFDEVTIGRPGVPGIDCDQNGIVDTCDIAAGAPDINHNGTPDTCECIGDIYVDRAINGADLGALLAYWGPTTSAAASRACDLNGDGVVNGSDLGILLAYWGPCSN